MVRSNVFSGCIIRMDGRLVLRRWAWRETGWDGKGGNGILGAACTRRLEYA